VLHRLLDVVFQYFAVLVAVLVVPPVAAFALGIALDRTQVVTARLWADEAAVLSGSPYTGKDNGESAAQHQSTLLLELLQTDSFVSAVISSSDVTATGPADPRAVAEDLRRNVAVSPEGPHVVIIVYPTAQPDRGVALMKAVVTAFEQAQVGVQTSQVTVADEALQTQLKTARKEMDDAVAAVQHYQSSHDVTTLTTDASFQSLRALATVKVGNYASLVKQADQAAQYQSAIPSVQTTVLRTVDPPRAARPPVNVKGSPGRNALYVLAAVVAIELAFVYNITRRDQRVRTPHEVVASLGLRSLGTAPEPGSASAAR